MTSLILTLPASGTAPALLTLPQPLTAQTLRDLGHAVADTLALLGRDLLANSPGLASSQTLSRAEAAEIEYASWMPDRGALEFDSWAAHLQACVR